MKTNSLSPSELLALKSILFKMLSQDRISEEEVIDVLRKSGLARIPNSESWMDETGAKYSD